MVSLERSRKRVQVWKKAIVHFILCFIMGFFTGFAPTSKSSFSSTSNQLELAPQSFPTLLQTQATVDTNLIAETPQLSVVSTDSQSETLTEKVDESELNPGKLLVLITPTTSMEDDFKGAFLTRLSNTIRLVPPPLLWIVVEAQRDANSNTVSEMLRRTGIMYRHLVLKENFTDPEEEMNNQRNIALKHIEQHRLSGIVHFFGLSNVYDLEFFNQLREIEVFGTWPMALVSANRRKVRIEGPVCDSSEVIGWHLKKMKNETSEGEEEEQTPPIHISSFGFNSSILWDPERWGRPSSAQGTSQNSIKFVKEVVLEDESKLKGIPTQGCSKIMLWNIHLPIPSSSH